MPFDFQPLALPDVQLILPRVFPDDRGAFLETYKETDFTAAGIPGPFVQDNQSLSRRGVLRGLHFQRPPHAQAKLVQVLVGVIFDVVVDLRPESRAFGKWLGITLSGDEPRLLYVPAGFAHGFQVTAEKAVVQYKTSSLYCPGSDAGIRWNDPDLAIDWPLGNPVLSDKDKNLPCLKDLHG
jgi:dTDP-4-dehydrorhamnose 3,5-epimerase